MVPQPGNIFQKTGEKSTISEKNLVYSDEYMDTNLQEIVFNDVRIFYTDHKLKKRKIFHPIADFPPIQMHFLLEGKHNIESRRTVNRTGFSGNEHNLIYLPHRDLDFSYESKSAKLLGIQLTENFFYRYVNEDSRILSEFWSGVLKKSEARLAGIGNLQITPRIRAILFDIIHSKRKGYFKQLFLESKIAELLLHQLEQFEMHDEQALLQVKKDVEKLNYVKELIETDPLSDFSLHSLARKAGINDFKLKKGFKILFGSTVFDYLNNLKMEYSKHLLLDEKKSIAETSDILGYSQPQHFSAAFKKRFGYPPRQLKIT